MRAYASLGDQDMVASPYEHCNEAIVREQDLEPSKDTQNLLVQLRVGTDSNLVLSSALPGN